MKLNSTGFTAVELMVVVAMAGIFYTLSIAPSVMANQKSKFQGYKVTLRDVLQTSRNLARTKQECVTLDIQPGAIVMKSFIMPPPAVCAAPFVNPDTSSTTTFDSSVTLTQFNTGNPFVFNNNGGTVYTVPSIMSIAAYGNSTTYTIEPLIGQIKNQ